MEKCNIDNYWNNFYFSQKEKVKNSLPSQFAVFMLTELQNNSHIIIDIGCGNGKDSFFFLDFNHYVIGVDRSREAISYCNSIKKESISFINSSIDNDELIDKINCILKDNKKPKVIYSRFFLHAINEIQQENLLKLARDLLKKGELFFLEFRTEKDKYQIKQTKEHYRRFINPNDFILQAIKYDFKINYFIEGFGFAKYHIDDAHVARFILEAV